MKITQGVHYWMLWPRIGHLTKPCQTYRSSSSPIWACLQMVIGQGL